MKVTIEVTLTKVGDDPNQPADEVRDVLIEEIDGLVTIEVDETMYMVSTRAVES